MNSMKLFKIDWCCAMQQFQDNDEISIIRSEKIPTEKQAEETLTNMSTGSVYIEEIVEVKEIDIRKNKNNQFYDLKK